MNMTVAQTASGTEIEARDGAGEIIKAGVVAGIIGGMLMAMIMMVATAAGGMGLLAPLRLIAATFYGKDAMTGGGPLIVGLMVHMMNSMVFGVLFAWIAGRRLATLPALMAGVAFGVAIWAIMTFGGLPMLNPMMRESVAMMPVAWFIAHVAFGMGVGSAPALRRRIAAN
jgi:hypothetical protein